MNLFSNLLHINKEYLKMVLRPGDLAVDATLGRGHDALFMAGLVGSGGKVVGFDIQPEALEASRQSFLQAGINQYVFHLAGHENMKDFVKEKARAVVFNLGYLPGSDKTVITRRDTTAQALGQALEILAEGGILSVMFYPGHEGGSEEWEENGPFLSSLDKGVFEVLRIQHMNRREGAPFLVLIYRKKEG